MEKKTTISNERLQINRYEFRIFLFKDDKIIERGCDARVSRTYQLAINVHGCRVNLEFQPGLTRV